jgi:mono/diheme cytochrome c family protein
MIDQYVSREELRRLLAGLMLVVGALLLFALFAFLLVPGLRNANRPAATAPVAAVAGESGWLDPTEYPAARGYDIPAIDPRTVLTPTPAQTERGRKLYGRYCSSCHGASGQGDGPASIGLRPAPRNFSVAAGWKNGTGRAAIFAILRKGVPGSAMVAYDFLPRKDRMALVHYVQSLGHFEHPAETSAARALLDKELAAPGERVPNRIPVSAAEARLIAESIAPTALAGRGAESSLLRQAVADPVRVARVLSASVAWRSDVQELARLASADAPANGFRAEVATLTAEEWRELLVALSGALPARKD